MASTYYSILNISTSATQRDIKVAYRKLVQQHHPDVNTSGNDELIKHINVAYETLSDPNKKAIYDRSLLRSFSQPVSTTFYSQPAYTSRPRRRPPPHSYNRYQNKTSDTTYTYSTKTKLQGWGAVVITVICIWFGFMGLHYYASGYYYDKAVLAEADQNFYEAYALYQLAVRDYGSKSVEASIKIVEINRKEEAFIAMVDNSAIGFTYEPDSMQSAKLFYLQGIGLAHNGDYEKAEWAFQNSLNFNFSKDSVYRKLAPIELYQLKNYKKAGLFYAYLLSNNSPNTSDYFNRATCYQLQGKHQLAIDDLLIILEDDPYSGKIIFQLGRSYLALGQKEVACEYFIHAQKQGINIDPNELSKTCD